jgi:replication factor C subunit 3/5
MSDEELDDTNEQIKSKQEQNKIVNPKQLYKNTLSLLNQLNNTIIKKREDYKSPWMEKFRPYLLNDVISHKHIIDTFKKFIINKQLPHLILYGPPGIGKTSTILAFAHEFYGENFHLMVLNINASEERGIEVVRNKIKDFASTKGIFLPVNIRKLIILDEADAITSDAQIMLKSIMEIYSFNVRFCLVCNYIKKIQQSLQSRCTLFKFSPLSHDDIKSRINSICNVIKIKTTTDGINTLVKLSKGDLRKVLNTLQIVNMLDIKSITEDTITKLTGYPKSEDVKQIIHLAINKEIKISYNEIRNIIYNFGFSLADLISEISCHIINEFTNSSIKINPDKFRDIINNLRNIELNLSVCPNEQFQLLGVISTLTLLKL